jgi:meromycolic acid enoyl-[acyl-carrier protein] reductase
MPMLEGKKLLITGVVNRESIAYEVARQAQEAGAEVVLTSFGRVRRMTERSAAKLPQPPDVLELDVNNPDDLAAIAAELRDRWGRVDGILHAIAFAPEDALGGNFLDTPAESAEVAFRTSAYSLKALAVALKDLFPDEGASVVGLDFDASVAWPSYDWMGVSKAALEAVNRYLARELGPRGIRTNLISAGPISSPAAGGVSGFEQLADGWDDAAPLGWDTSDPAPVAGAVCFLFSEASRAISGELIHVDGGAHAVAPAASGEPPVNGAVGQTVLSE